MRLLGRLFGRKSGPAPSKPLRAGDLWEERAEQFLEDKGYMIVGRDVRTRRSDLDIVARDGDTTVFVEVKARNTRDFGGPGAFIDERKQRKLISAAKEYLVRKGLTSSPCRFDAVLFYTGVNPPEIEHIENAFEERLQ